MFGQAFDNHARLCRSGLLYRLALAVRIAGQWVHNMPHAPRTSIGREFDRFLFAAVADDRHGQRLSFISLLARSDVDPWEAAANLENMPRETATARLAALIAAALPEDASTKLPADVIAADLIGLLPRESKLAPPSLPESLADISSENARAILGFIGLVLLIAIALIVSAPQSRGPGQRVGPVASSEMLSAELFPFAPHR
jgi:hypothetical protein